MADLRPTPVRPAKAVVLCLFGMFAPARLAAEEARDSERRESQVTADEEHRPAHAVCRAFWKSLVLVLAAGALGFVGGRMAGAAGLCATSSWIGGLQIVGSMALLWGTLFVRGWEIQTFCGTTLIEKVNQWLYRALYLVGTATLVFSLTIQPWRP